MYRGLGLIFIALVIFLLLYLDLDQLTNIEDVGNLIKSYGPLAPLIYIFIMMLAIIISPIPSLPLAVMAGAMWGPYIATIYSVIGAEIGAIISFLIARKLGRGFIKKLFHKDIDFCIRCENKALPWIIFISRLFPFFQFDIISYGAGLTSIKLRSFAIATFFGMIPMTFVFAQFGEVLIVGGLASTILTILLISFIFIVPVIIKKYNILGIYKEKSDK